MTKTAPLVFLSALAAATHHHLRGGQLITNDTTQESGFVQTEALADATYSQLGDGNHNTDGTSHKTAFMQRPDLPDLVGVKC